MNFLMLTTLDVLGRRNNREHHVIAAARQRFDQVTVVFRKRGAADRRFGAMMTTDRMAEIKGNVTYIGINPLLNPPDGAVRARTQSEDKNGGHLRRAVGHAMDSAAILRDKMTIRALHDAGLSVTDSAPLVTMALGPWAARAAERLRSSGHIGPYVYVDRDYEPGFMTSPLRRAWAMAQERRAVRQADLTLCIGRRLAGRFENIRGSTIKLSPTGVDSGSIPQRSRKTPCAKLLFVGEVAPYSGIEEAIAALPAIATHQADAVLRVIGPVQDGYRAYLEHLADVAGVRDRIFIMGSRDRSEVFQELDQAGIGLAVFQPHPLRIHAAPLKVLEYMAAGLPVLALEGSEAGDIVTGAGIGLVCACTQAGIMDGVLRLLGDSAGYIAFSLAGPPAAAARDWAKVMRDEFALIDSLYQNGRGTG
ncbi:glycosyltransferase [Sulfitobacter sp. W027]|uniref:glycosyltransferase n=1 Tax=Sulfitobacter sp. W027 TaxID=2867025 RepID=UPI0021A366F6|nr:glycosyltransferase [Sulfitobacter sp. W027]UWR32287.1 glycosyltransferase [Sulfitobacter sp. W027]